MHNSVHSLIFTLHCTGVISMGHKYFLLSDKRSWYQGASKVKTDVPSITDSNSRKRTFFTLKPIQPTNVLICHGTLRF